MKTFSIVEFVKEEIIAMLMAIVMRSTDIVMMNTKREAGIRSGLTGN